MSQISAPVMVGAFGGLAAFLGLPLISDAGYSAAGLIGAAFFGCIGVLGAAYIGLLTAREARQGDYSRPKSKDDDE